MIFISSKVPLSLIPITKEEICEFDWFLFDSSIRNKDYLRDDSLDIEFNRLCIYPVFYADKLYNYLMSDNYYYKTNLFNTLRNMHTFPIMDKVLELCEITDYDTQTINKEKRIYKREDVKKMFESFRENNFKENPICEYVLDKK